MISTPNLLVVTCLVLSQPDAQELLPELYLQPLHVELTVLPLDMPGITAGMLECNGIDTDVASSVAELLFSPRARVEFTSEFDSDAKPKHMWDYRSHIKLNFEPVGISPKHEFDSQGTKYRIETEIDARIEASPFLERDPETTRWYPVADVTINVSLKLERFYQQKLFGEPFIWGWKTLDESHNSIQARNMPIKGMPQEIQDQIRDHYERGGPRTLRVENVLHNADLHKILRAIPMKPRNPEDPSNDRTNIGALEWSPLKRGAPISTYSVISTLENSRLNIAIPRSAIQISTWNRIQAGPMLTPGWTLRATDDENAELVIQSCTYLITEPYGLIFRSSHDAIGNVTECTGTASVASAENLVTSAVAESATVIGWHDLHEAAGNAAFGTDSSLKQLLIDASLASDEWNPVGVSFCTCHDIMWTVNPKSPWVQVILVNDVATPDSPIGAISRYKLRWKAD